MAANAFRGNDNKHSPIAITIADTPFVEDQGQAFLQSFDRTRFSASFESDQAELLKAAFPNARAMRQRFEVGIEGDQNSIIRFGNRRHKRVF